MLIQTLQVKSTETGAVKATAPYVRYKLNDTQELFIVGVETDDVPTFEPNEEGVTAFFMGRLSELPFPMGHMAMNSLGNDEWDFAAHPDPHCIVIEYPSPFNS